MAFHLIEKYIDEIYWNFKIGRSVKKLSVFSLRNDLKKHIKSPVFFLSTGRCGTQWFSNLLSTKENVVLHSPVPSFASQNRTVYKTLINENTTENEINLIKEIYLTGREQHLRYSSKSAKKMIETNNYITFFAPVLATIFPDAKFVHLYRHPGEFVRSGIRRNYYTKNNPDDIKRIVPLNNEDWPDYSQIKKIAWLWRETNTFIEKFKMKNECYSFNFNGLDPDNVMQLVNYLQIDIEISRVKKQLNKKLNVQKTGSFENYINWDDNQKNELKETCGELANTYGYTL